MHGVLLHASPPVKHESPSSYQGYEVTKYQPPWKSFSQFAIQNDSEDCTHTPGFQHLVNQVRVWTINFTELFLTFQPFNTASRLRFERRTNRQHISRERLAQKSRQHRLISRERRKRDWFAII